MEDFSRELWLFSGDTVSFHGMPYTTRMTIVRLRDRGLWIHSPVAITDELLSQVCSLGEPRYIVSPNKLHHFHLKQWQERFPQAKLFAPPGLAEKRADIAFDAQLAPDAQDEWGDEIDQTIFKGSPAMEEVVFFHRASKTLILGDLIENFPQDHFGRPKKMLAKAAGILSPNGKTPLDWRLTFMFGKASARESLQTLLDWNPENVVLAHGECIRAEGTEALRKSFSWLL